MINQSFGFKILARNLMPTIKPIPVGIDKLKPEQSINSQVKTAKKKQRLHVVISIISCKKTLMLPIPYIIHFPAKNAILDNKINNHQKQSYKKPAKSGI